VVAPINFETINLARLLTTWRWKCEQNASGAAGICHWETKLTSVPTNAPFAKIVRTKWTAFVQTAAANWSGGRGGKAGNDKSRRMNPQGIEPLRIFSW